MLKALTHMWQSVTVRNKRVYMQLAMLVRSIWGDGIAFELWNSGMV